jgi:hypothetical protein
MSRFNQDMCCEICTFIERQHPRYKDAKDKENDEVINGNLNYEGIGLPPKYFEWAGLEYEGWYNTDNAFKELVNRHFHERIDDLIKKSEEELAALDRADNDKTVTK